MKVANLVCVVLFVASLSSSPLLSQDKATVHMEKTKPGGGTQAGSPISLIVKLNAPLPPGARFLVRVSPVAADQRIELYPSEPLNGERTRFRLTGTIPEGALPGKWHIRDFYLMLAGSNWTSNTIKPNDFEFEVEGKSYEIPTTAEVSMGK